MIPLRVLHILLQFSPKLFRTHVVQRMQDTSTVLISFYLFDLLDKQTFLVEVCTLAV